MIRTKKRPTSICLESNRFCMDSLSYIPNSIAQKKISQIPKSGFPYIGRLEKIQEIDLNFVILQPSSFSFLLGCNIFE